MMVADRMKISSNMVWFIIHPVQFGMSELWFDRFLVEDAGYDGWMGIVIAGIAAHLLIWMIYSIMKKGHGGVIDIHRQVFGKWLGGGFSVLLIVLFLLEGISVLRSYEEIVQVWLFPGMGTWFLGIIVLLLIYYAVAGGFRIVVGVCFFGFLIPIIALTPVLAFPLKYGHFSNMLPMFTHPVSDLLMAAKDMTMSFIGFEGLLVAYPFIKNAPSSQKWAHFGNFFTMQFYLLITFITFAYFSKGLMDKMNWPNLNLVEMTRLPFLQGFEYVFISLWLMVILPNLAYAVWAASRAAKELFSVRQRKTLAAVLAIVFAVPLFFHDHSGIVQLNKAVASYAFYFLILYLPVLWVAQRVRGKWAKKRTGIKV